MAISDPPLQRILDTFNWLPQVLLKLTGPQSDMFRQGDVAKGCVIVIIVDLYELD
jgi:hypothetical protein